MLNSLSISKESKIYRKELIKMAVKIRLTRMGSKKNLTTVSVTWIHVRHVMVVHQETVGTTIPLVEENQVTLKEDRVLAWLADGSSTFRYSSVSFQEGGLEEVHDSKNSQNNRKSRLMYGYDWKSHYCSETLDFTTGCLTISRSKILLNSWSTILTLVPSVGRVIGRKGPHHFCDKNDCLLCPNWR